MLSAKEAAEKLCGKIPPLVGGEGYDCQGVELEALFDQLQAFEPAAFEAFRIGLERVATKWGDDSERYVELEEWEYDAAHGTSRQYTAAKLRRLMDVVGLV